LQLVEARRERLRELAAELEEKLDRLRDRLREHHAEILLPSFEGFADVGLAELR
jgi:hypothetical protein